MSAVWQVQEAKNHFSELIERALREGPQTVTRHGKPVVRVVAVTEGEAQAPADDGFLEFLLSAPKVEGGLPEMPRDTSPGRAPMFGED
ncbi:MAG TPA: type II toxin-antitoxin system Phd/YefM family antitoxin [Alicycliphilus sp.]|nr:type II toxin-antitoxin system Phd/YefM family antitoxin [Alicycliphilus sp.]